MWEIAVAIGIWAGTPIPQGPHYHSCKDGTIVLNIADCPPIKDHKPPPQSTGHGGGSGLLGLGGLGGFL